MFIDGRWPGRHGVRRTKELLNAADMDKLRLRWDGRHSLRSLPRGPAVGRPLDRDGLSKP